jgi:hypothetical protein
MHCRRTQAGRRLGHDGREPGSIAVPRIERCASESRKPVLAKELESFIGSNYSRTNIGGINRHSMQVRQETSIGQRIILENIPGRSELDL